MSIIPGLQNLVVKTRFGPIPIDLESSEGSAPTDLTSRLLKPAVAVTFMGQPMTLYAPYGDPGNEDYWTALATGVVGLAALTMILLYRGWTR